MIFNGGSAMNFIAKEAVEKLKLPTTKRPRPYKIAWVHDSTILDDKQCIVPFKLGSYEDTIKCDVIPRKVTQILFGRPWLKKLKVVTDNDTNTRTFRWKGKKTWLWSLPPQYAEAPKEAVTPQILTMSKFEQESRDQDMMYALVIRQVLDESPHESIPEEVKPLLQHFSDFIPDELPNNLPPMRDIH